MNSLLNGDEVTLEVKFAPELKENDIIIHDHKKYLVEKYWQGVGMGHDLWGEYGGLIVREIRKPVWIDNWRNVAKVEDEVAGPKSETINTYKNYPFIVLTRKEGVNNGK